MDEEKRLHQGREGVCTIFQRDKNVSRNAVSYYTASHPFSAWVCASSLDVFLTGAIHDGSLAWAELYFVIAALVQTFDFEFTTARAEDFECVSDQFVIGTKGRGFLEAVVKVYEE